MEKIIKRYFRILYFEKLSAKAAFLFFALLKHIMGTDNHYKKLFQEKRDALETSLLFLIYF